MAGCLYVFEGHSICIAIIERRNSVVIYFILDSSFFCPLVPSHISFVTLFAAFSLSIVHAVLYQLSYLVIRALCAIA